MLYRVVISIGAALPFVEASIGGSGLSAPEPQRTGLLRGLAVDVDAVEHGAFKTVLGEYRLVFAG